MASLGATIRDARQKKGWGVKKLARIAGVASHNLWRIERGAVRCPRQRTLFLIAKALDLDAGELVAMRRVVRTTRWEPRNLSQDSFGKLIFEARKRAGLTDIELSKRVGLGRSALFHLEAGDVLEPKLGTLLKIAKALRVPVTDLIPKHLTDAEPASRQG